MTWKRFLKLTLTPLLSAGVLYLIGLVIGATYGGNYAQDFEIGGLCCGYEATGVLAGGILALIGFCGMLWILIHLERKKSFRK